MMCPFVEHLRREPGTLSQISLMFELRKFSTAFFCEVSTAMIELPLHASLNTSSTLSFHPFEQPEDCREACRKLSNAPPGSQIGESPAQSLAVGLLIRPTSMQQQSKRQRLSGSLSHSKINDVMQAGSGLQAAHCSKPLYGASSMHTPMRQRPANNKAPALAQSRKHPLRWLHQGTANAENVSVYLLPTALPFTCILIIFCCHAP